MSVQTRMSGYCALIIDTARGSMPIFLDRDGRPAYPGKGGRKTRVNDAKLTIIHSFQYKIKKNPAAP